MWGLDQLMWRIRSAKLVQNGANAIQAFIIEEIMATIKHFYLVEHDGHQNFFYK